MKKYGFLFGAGAEIVYGLPNGGEFALNIFKYDPATQKESFCKMRDFVDPITPYASDWLPYNYLNKRVSIFGRSIFETIISSTIEHNRTKVIDTINDFDETAVSIVRKMCNDDVDSAFKIILGKPVSNVRLSQKIAYNKYLADGDKLFKSHYFSSMILVYKLMNDNKDARIFLGNVITSIVQLHMGALGENLSHFINENPFEIKEDGVDLFDNLGDLLQINYKAAGTMGLELLFDGEKQISKMVFENKERESKERTILEFGLKMVESIYSLVLDYKTLIDSYWHYLYSPRVDWAKFCKISIFLLTVHEYISELGGRVNKDNPDGYYNMLRSVIEAGKIEAKAIATTNYNGFIADILGRDDIVYLNGSTSLWYDPYLNKTGTKEELEKGERHIIVPLLFTQSGTKPITSIRMSERYVDLYRSWKKKEIDAVVVVGYGFNPDDEHINGILRTLAVEDKKELIIVTKSDEEKDEKDMLQEIEKKLKTKEVGNIKVIPVNDEGIYNGKHWVDHL